MNATAVILEAPGSVALRPLELLPLGPADVVVETAWTGVSAGTEKLLWTGRMPAFPGMGYPLVPGYEAVGRVVDAGADARSQIGQWVYVPGASCYVQARGLFGATAARLVVPAARALPVSEALGERGVLLALAATAVHALEGGAAPELIVGHGVLGRLLARAAIARGAAAPMVWETDPARRDGAQGYSVLAPEADARRDYRAIYDASGDAGALDALIARLARGGEIVLAGFYDQPIAFLFAPAFQREARLRIAAEWRSSDLASAAALVASGALSLDGLISHVRPAGEAEEAYPAAFEDRRCLKMVLDWEGLA